METAFKNNAICFYLGLLPKSANRNTLLPALSAFGKVLRIRVAREQSDLACKGYGYAWIEPFVATNEFSRLCLSLPSPILAYPIDGPKLLGCENTRMLRRFVRLENLKGKFSYNDLLTQLEFFGSLALVVTEFEPSGTQKVDRLHALFKYEASVLDLSTCQQHSIKGELVEMQTFIGLQENPFEENPRANSIVTHCELQELGISPTIGKNITVVHEKLNPNPIAWLDGASKLAKLDEMAEVGSSTSKEEGKRGDRSLSKSKSELPSMPHYYKLGTTSYHPGLNLQKPATITITAEKQFGTFATIPEYSEFQNTLSRRLLRRFGFILKERHNPENLRFNVSV